MNRKNWNKTSGLHAKTESFIFTSQFLSVHTSYLTLSCLITTRARTIKERVGKEGLVKKKKTLPFPVEYSPCCICHTSLDKLDNRFVDDATKNYIVVIPSLAKNILIYLRVRK